MPYSYQRQILDRIKKMTFKGRALVIYGARRTGKTTLVKEYLKDFSREESTYLNCDEFDVRTALEDKTSTELGAFIGKKKIIVLDEAQRVRNIGLAIKLLVDNFPGRQVIATGSSSFELSNRIKESLTGRKFEFHLFPLSIGEIAARYSGIEIGRLTEKFLIYGMYPEVMDNGAEMAAILLKELASSYLYKDVLNYQNIRNPEILELLVKALALQMGSEVSLNELASLLKIDKNTVASYIRILEAAFVVFQVGSFSRNLRNELKKSRKIYFYDNGIRNALINNLNPLSLRDDVGRLWDNFIVSERLKMQSNLGQSPSHYFWRTHQNQEIDLVEEENGQLSAFEIKWNPKRKFAIPSAFKQSYPDASFTLVNNQNYIDFLTTDGH
jgi:predicted AAA+ superfamily ATPase